MMQFNTTTGYEALCKVELGLEGCGGTKTPENEVVGVIVVDVWDHRWSLSASRQSLREAAALGPKFRIRSTNHVIAEPHA